MNLDKLIEDGWRDIPVHDPTVANVVDGHCRLAAADVANGHEDLVEIRRGRGPELVRDLEWATRRPYNGDETVRRYGAGSVLNQQAGGAHRRRAVLFQLRIARERRRADLARDSPALAKTAVEQHVTIRRDIPQAHGRRLKNQMAGIIDS